MSAERKGFRHLTEGSFPETHVVGASVDKAVLPCTLTTLPHAVFQTDCTERF
jgi:hypothetical protein